MSDQLTNKYSGSKSGLGSRSELKGAVVVTWQVRRGIRSSSTTIDEVSVPAIHPKGPLGVV